MLKNEELNINYLIKNIYIFQVLEKIINQVSKKKKCHLLGTLNLPGDGNTKDYITYGRP